MDKKELTLEELEKIIGGMEYGYATVPATEVAVILDTVWRLKTCHHYTKEQTIEEICANYRTVQRQEVTDIINQYWDKLY